MRHKALAALSCAALLAAHFASGCRKPAVRIGVLHSLSGPMAMSERPLVDAVLMAVDEANASGGVGGRRIEAVVADGKSDPAVFRREAGRLISQEGVRAIFGCWTSASRKAVKPVVEANNSILFYPVQYEGMEQSPNIVYLGAAPNQQIIPAVTWALENLGPRFYLVGSDYVFPRAANALAKEVLRLRGGEVVGEVYVPLGGGDFGRIAEDIRRKRPDAVLNTVNGAGNGAFFEALHDAGLASSRAPVLSLSVSENEMQAVLDGFRARRPKEADRFLKSHLAGTFACWTYFESLDSPENRAFVARLRKKFGPGFRAGDPVEAAYDAVFLWRQAVAECAGVGDTASILSHLHHVSIPAPGGVLGIAENNHSYSFARVGRFNGKGAFDLVWSSKFPIAPLPFPPFRDRAYWEGVARR
jgi:urea transport system substrate-binding protein